VKTTGNDRDGNPSKPTNGTRDAKLKALMRREAAVKAALEALREEKKRQRSLNRATAGKIYTLIGAAVAADLETTSQETPQHKTYVSEILNQHYTKGSGGRALLEANGWL
jgi:hypothetical protein